MNRVNQCDTWARYPLAAIVLAHDACGVSLTAFRERRAANFPPAAGA